VEGLIAGACFALLIATLVVLAALSTFGFTWLASRSGRGPSELERAAGYVTQLAAQRPELGWVKQGSMLKGERDGLTAWAQPQRLIGGDTRMALAVDGVPVEIHVESRQRGNGDFELSEDKDNSPRVRAAMAAPGVQAMLVRLAGMTQDLTVGSGRVGVDVLESRFGDAPAILDDLLALAETLRALEPSEPAEVFAGRSAQEQIEILRDAQRCDDRDGTDEHEVLGRYVLNDPEAHPKVRLWAAKMLRDLRVLGMMVADAETSAADRREVYRLLRGEAAPLLAEAVASDAEWRWVDAMVVVVDDPSPDGLAAICPLLERAAVVASDQAMVLDAMLMLLRSELGSERLTIERVRPWLDARDERLILAAVQRMGAVGSVSDVPDLRRREAVSSGVLQLALGQAVSRIQERAGGERGGLALADPDERGALALASARVAEGQPGGRSGGSGRNP
jgi:hypothetical protein